jgi:hypothetical protein
MAEKHNEHADSGYDHWHELGKKKPPGHGIPDRKAPDSGPGGLSSGSPKQERKVMHDPAPKGMDPMRQVGRQVKPIGS